MADKTKILIHGTLANEFSIGLKTYLSTITVDGTYFILDKALNMGTHKIINVVDPVGDQDAMTLKYADDNYINLDEKGAASGVATLDANSKIPVAQLPNSVMEYKGAWDASTNLPVLADGGAATAAYKVIQDLTYTADTAGLAGNSITIAYTTGATAGSEVVTVVDNAISVQIETGVSTATQVKTAVDGKAEAAALVDVTISGTAGNAQTAPVSATNLTYGQDAANTGDVYRASVAGTQDLGSGNITFYVGDFAIYNSNDVWERSPMADGVQSVFGRTGVVEATAGDYTASEVTNVAAGNIVAVTVQAAINELDDEKMALVVTPTDGHVLTTDENGQAEDSGLVVTTDVDSGSTDSEIPTAKAAYDAIGTSMASALSSIKVTVAQAAATTSTAQVPAGSIIEKIVVLVTAAYDNVAELNVVVNSVTLVANASTDLTQTDKNIFELYATNAGATVVTVNLTNTPTEGTALVIVYYSTPLV